MNKFIRAVFINKTTTLFLLGMNKQGELVFRSSYDSRLIQREKPVIGNGTCFLNLYFFSEKYLEGLPTINE